MITLFQGHSAKLRFTIGDHKIDIDTVPEFIFTIKTRESDTTALLTKTADYDAQTRTGTVTLLDTDTANLSLATLFCEVLASYAPSQNYVIAKDQITITH